MKKNLSRRDFLKLVSLLPLTSIRLPSNEIFRVEEKSNNDKHNVIIIVYDTMSARNLSLYGYPRRTTPNLERFAKQATVFHAHYSAANFTTPGISSLLTGTYPWTHRAINLQGLIKRGHEEFNLFRLFGPSFYRLAFSQNLFADLLLFQFENEIDHHVKMGSFSLFHHMDFDGVFKRDAIIAYKGLNDFMLNTWETPGSMFVSRLEEAKIKYLWKTMMSEYGQLFPRGVPSHIYYNYYFLLEKIIDGAISILNDIVFPALIYLHFYPPHESFFLKADPEMIYTPRKEFIGIFNEYIKTDTKQASFYTEGYTPEYLSRKQLEYDEYIAYTDSEFNRLYQFLEVSGFLENSYVVVTSDHGQLFERGVHGHSNPYLYEPLIQVPLLIHKPGQKTREDIFSITSSVDLLPTLLDVIGRPIPDECEGELLPGFGGYANVERSIFAVEAKSNPANRPLRLATLAMRKGRYKIIYYTGYPDYNDRSELYDLQNDPDELIDISNSNQVIVEDMKAELKNQLKQADARYSG